MRQICATDVRRPKARDSIEDLRVHLPLIRLSTVFGTNTVAAVSSEHQRNRSGARESDSTARLVKRLWLAGELSVRPGRCKSVRRSVAHHSAAKARGAD